MNQIQFSIARHRSLTQEKLTSKNCKKSSNKPNFLYLVGPGAHLNALGTKNFSPIFIVSLSKNDVAHPTKENAPLIYNAFYFGRDGR
jgi:hypothetical protein